MRNFMARTNIEDTMGWPGRRIYEISSHGSCFLRSPVATRASYQTFKPKTIEVRAHVPSPLEYEVGLEPVSSTRTLRHASNNTSYTTVTIALSAPALRDGS